MLTDKERQRALDSLTKTRQTLLDAVAGVSENQARWKPAPERWSIFEYVEHLAVSDDALIALVERSLKTPAQPETEEERRQREAKIRATPIPRGANHAPDAMKPHGRFATLSDAVSAFLAARGRSLEYARTTTDDLRSHFSSHPVLGPLDCYQWLTGNAHHVETHAAHIRELRTLPGFPA
jgi:hypothetical protein